MFFFYLFCVFGFGISQVKLLSVLTKYFKIGYYSPLTAHAQKRVVKTDENRYSENYFEMLTKVSTEM